MSPLIGTGGKKQTSRPVAAVDRALRVLTSFSKTDRALPLSELSARTGLYPSTTLRMLDSLEASGLLRRLPDKTYVLGTEVLRLAAICKRTFNIEQFVRPVLQHLAQSTGESAALFTIEGEQRICLFREDSPKGIRDHGVEGDTFPKYRGAAGRVLKTFANLPYSKWSPALTRKLPFVSLGEVDADIAAMSVPVFAHDDGVVGALTLMGPVARFTPPIIKRQSSLLIRAGEDLCRQLGATREA